MQQYIQDIDDIITHITDKPESIDSQAKSAFIRGIGDDQLIRKLLNKLTTFTYCDCARYALEYEHTEDKLKTHKKDNVITVGTVSEHPTQAAQKPPKQTALVCECCEKPRHQGHTCIMPVEKTPTHKIPKWYLDKLNKKQNKSKGGYGPQGGQGNNQHGGYGNPPCNQASQPYVYPYSMYPPPVPQTTQFGQPPTPNAGPLQPHGTAGG